MSQGWSRSASGPEIDLLDVGGDGLGHESGSAELKTTVFHPRDKGFRVQFLVAAIRPDVR
jgi:hypothetical protein